MTNHMPDISVLVPVYNQERFIGRCLRSLLAQTMQRNKYEIIVVNDGSHDRTSYALELFKEEIITIHQDNQGLPAALNQGISMARAPFVVRVDSDDYVNAHFLELLHLFMTQNRYIDAMACDYLLIDDAEEVLSRKNCMEEPIACGIMFHTEHLIDIGLYDETFLLHEERELRQRFLKKYNISRLELPLYRYRKHDGNMTNDISKMEFYEQLLKEKDVY